MSRSQRLRIADYRAIFEWVHRVAAVGGDPAAWRREALVGLCALTGGQVAFTADMVDANGPQPPRMVRPIDLGWATASSQARFVSYFASGEVTGDPGTTTLLESQKHVRWLTWTRRQLLDDRTWYSAKSVSETRRAGGVDDFISSTLSLAPGVLQGFLAYRPWGDRPFGARERRVARVFHVELIRLARPAATAATAGTLSPRLRQTLELLLAGLSTKEAAARLGLSAHTVNDYSKALHRHFGVHSRAELLSHHRQRPPTPGVLRLPAELLM